MQCPGSAAQKIKKLSESPVPTVAKLCLNGRKKRPIDKQLSLTSYPAPPAIYIGIAPVKHHFWSIWRNLGALHVVKWGIPEKILQNEVQTH